MVAAPWPLDGAGADPLIHEWLQRVREDPKASVLRGSPDEELWDFRFSIFDYQTELTNRKSKIENRKFLAFLLFDHLQNRFRLLIGRPFIIGVNDLAVFDQVGRAMSQA